MVNLFNLNCGASLLSCNFYDLIIISDNQSAPICTCTTVFFRYKIVKFSAAVRENADNDQCEVRSCDRCQKMVLFKMKMKKTNSEKNVGVFIDYKCDYNKFVHVSAPSSGTSKLQTRRGIKGEVQNKTYVNGNHIIRPRTYSLQDVTSFLVV